MSTSGINIVLSKKDSEKINIMCQKFPSLSYREILVMFKYVPKEKLEKALFQVSSFMTVEEYLNKLCNLNPVTIYRELYSE